MPELERELRALATAVDYPSTPQFAGRVAARLRAQAAPPRGLGPGRALALGALTVALALAAVLGGSRQAADALLDAYGLSGVRIERSDDPAPQAQLREPRLGPRVGLAEAASRLGFEPLLPRVLGAPDDVRLRRGASGARLSLVYDPQRGLPPATTTGAGLLVTEFRGSVVPEYLVKVVGPETEVEQLRLDGDRAVLITGAPHFFLFRDPAGEVIEERLQVAENVLLIERGGVVVRMEGAFERATALRLARSLVK